MPLTIEIAGECPPPRTLATGEQECPSCGRIWDEDDGAPACRGDEEAE